MNPSPIHRLTAAAGLALLVPIAVRLATGALELQAAATRSVVLLAAIVGLQWMLRTTLTLLASVVEQRDTPAKEATGVAGTE